MKVSRRKRRFTRRRTYTQMVLWTIQKHMDRIAANVTKNNALYQRLIGMK
jgi:hypothetical protein